MSESSNPKWAELLHKAVSEPGTVSAAYSSFHDYSAGNQMLALWQCHARGIAPGPISTYPGWLAKGRHVKRGEKALTLCMPVIVKRRPEQAEEADDSGEVKADVMTVFVYRPRWFVLSQTDPNADARPLGPLPLPMWDKTTALQALEIAEVAFEDFDGNSMGYACRREVAVSPLAFDYWKTLFHEVGHVLMHTGAASDRPEASRALREVEAEAVALICGEALGLGSQSECRGYIQGWLAQHGSQSIPEASAKRIFSAADKILRAGRPARAAADDEQQAA